MELQWTGSYELWAAVKRVEIEHAPIISIG